MDGAHTHTHAQTHVQRPSQGPRRQLSAGYEARQWQGRSGEIKAAGQERSGEVRSGLYLHKNTGQSEGVRNKQDFPSDALKKTGGELFYPFSSFSLDGGL